MPSDGQRVSTPAQAETVAAPEMGMHHEDLTEVDRFVCASGT